MKENYESVKLLFGKIKYDEFKWKLCGDLKVVALLLGMQLGYTKFARTSRKSHKAANYQDVVQNMLTSYKAMGCNVSLKIHFLESHLDFFPENLGEVSDEHGERFHQ